MSTHMSHPSNDRARQLGRDTIDPDPQTVPDTRSIWTPADGSMLVDRDPRLDPRGETVRC
ncbi:MAG TPA: hypothetical protein VLF67_00640 [Candidatus Saccharimonas sp.]|nr:hypothetical protein [Candidatus Saccharimonas sp.]